MLSDEPYVVFGGRSLIGHYLLPALASAGATGFVTSRGEVDIPSGFSRVSTVDLQSGTWQIPNGAIVLSLWPIWLLAPVLPRLAAARQIIALSSTSIFGKSSSTDPAEIEIVAKLSEDETALRTFADAQVITWTILRPTLIYDGVHDKSIMQIARMISRLGLFVVAGQAAGLRQPIHADDVSRAVLAAVGNSKAQAQSINIGGGAPITYREMVDRIAQGLGKKARLISLPTFACKALMRLLAMAGLTRLSPSLFDRMAEDLVFDHGESVEKLGISPRPFHPQFPGLTTTPSPHK